MKAMSVIGLIISLLTTIQGLIIAFGNPDPNMKMLAGFVIVVPNLFFIAFSLVSLRSTLKK
jgi:hypothetical protein